MRGTLCYVFTKRPCYSSSFLDEFHAGNILPIILVWAPPLWVQYPTVIWYNKV